MSQEPSYPQTDVAKRKVDDEVNDKIANMVCTPLLWIPAVVLTWCLWQEKSGPPAGNQKNKKFCVIRSTTSELPKNQVYIQLELLSKIPLHRVTHQHESRRSASPLNATPAFNQVDIPIHVNDSPLLPIESSRHEHASSTFPSNEEPTALLSGSRVRQPSVMDLSSDDGGFMPESDMLDQLLDEARWIGNPHKLLDNAWTLALNLPEAHPGDFLYAGMLLRLTPYSGPSLTKGQIPVKTASLLIAPSIVSFRA